MIRKYFQIIAIALFCACTFWAASVLAADAWGDAHYRGYMDEPEFSESGYDWHHYDVFGYDSGQGFWDDADRGHKSIGERHGYDFGGPPRPPYSDDGDEGDRGDEHGDGQEGRRGGRG